MEELKGSDQGLKLRLGTLPTKEPSDLALYQQEEQIIAGDKLQLFFSLDDDVIFKQEFKTGQNFEWVKSKVAEHLEIDYGDIMLYNGEKLIPDPFSISDLSLASGSVITMKLSEDCELEKVKFLEREEKKEEEERGGAAEAEEEKKE